MYFFRHPLQTRGLNIQPKMFDLSGANSSSIQSVVKIYFLNFFLLCRSAGVLWTEASRGRAERRWRWRPQTGTWR